MAVRRSRSLLCGSFVATISLAALKLADISFVGTQPAVRMLKVSRGYDVGKINIGDEITESAVLPQPVLEADETTNEAIMDCIDGGCSVEALLELDSKLARDEQRIFDAMAGVQAVQKTSQASQTGTLAWYENFLKRMGALRGQLAAVKEYKDADLVQQVMKAMSVSFGGQRPNDYPKVGVSPYSA